MRKEAGFTLHGRCAAGRTRIRPGHPGIYRRLGLPLWTLNYTAAGTGRFDGDGPQLCTEPGDLVLIKPEVPNDYGSVDDAGHWTHLWCIFHPADSWFRLLDWPEVLPGTYHLRPGNPTVREKVEAIFTELVAVAQGPWLQREELVLSMLRTLLWWCDTANPNAVRRSLDVRLQAALELLAERYAAPLGVEGLARAAGMSPSRFAHLFKEELGTSPIRYLERHRIERACDLLLGTGLPVADIAAEVGYEDPAYFARVFRRRTGMTPRAYRVRSRGR